VEQVIPYSKSKGIAPIMECTTCVMPSMSKLRLKLNDHQPQKASAVFIIVVIICATGELPSLGNATLDTKGFGTEQVETGN